MRPWFDLQNPTVARDALEQLRGFWKLWSACLLADVGLPVLPAVVLSPTAPLERVIAEQTTASRFPLWLIRHDKRPETPPYPRGGFLVGPQLVEDVIRYFFNLDRIVALYEPADPLLNGHNLNLLIDSETHLLVEVVGPGFDLSDLQRGDISPHETWTVTLSSSTSDFRLMQRTAQDAYEDSVKARLKKIEKKLRTVPTPDIAQRIREELQMPKNLQEHLETIGSPLVTSNCYQPLPSRTLENIVFTVRQSGIIRRFQEETATGFPLVVSTSFINRGLRQVFWDVVSPKLKYRSLTPDM